MCPTRCDSTIFDELHAVSEVGRPRSGWMVLDKTRSTQKLASFDCTEPFYAITVDSATMHADFYKAFTRLRLCKHHLQS